MSRLPLILILVADMALFAEAQNGVITGRVRRADGQPAAGVRVAVATPNGNGEITADTLGGITMTDSSGNYRIENVPPGRYGIVAGKVGSPTYYPGTANGSGATVVTLEPGRTVNGLDFTLAEATVSGETLLEFDKVVVDVDSNGVAATISGELLDLPDDPEQLLAYLKRLAHISTQAIRGRIVAENGGLPPGVLGNLRLVFVGNHVGNVSASVSADGSIKATLGSDDEYSVSVTRLDGKALDGYVVKSITLGSIDLVKEWLKTAGPVSGEIVITLAPAP